MTNMYKPDNWASIFSSKFLGKQFGCGPSTVIGSKPNYDFFHML